MEREKERRNRDWERGRGRQRERRDRDWERGRGRQRERRDRDWERGRGREMVRERQRRKSVSRSRSRSRGRRSNNTFRYPICNPVESDEMLPRMEWSKELQMVQTQHKIWHKLLLKLGNKNRLFEVCDLTCANPLF